jgi:hypothetical protein
MSTAGSDSTSTTGQQPSEEELRAAYEAEIKKIRVEHVLLEHVVTLVNLGMRRTGLAPGTEAERDPSQVQLAIEAIRSLLPLLERLAPEQIGPIRDALSQLQLAFVRIGGEQAAPTASEPADTAAGAGGAGGAPAGGAGGPAGGAGGGPAGGAGGAPASEPQPPKPGQPGPAQRTGRLWVPGQ